ncbi:hypothetical protein [Cohnella boryungensis]
MMKSIQPESATLSVVFALRVKAASKAQACESSMCQLSAKNLCLDRMRLTNEHGHEAWFAVERIEAIRWTSVESTGFSHQFKIVGQIRLAIRPDWSSRRHAVGSFPCHYRLPGSLHSDKTVWVIPTTNEPAFAQVLCQSIELPAPSQSFSLISAV